MGEKMGKGRGCVGGGLNFKSFRGFQSYLFGFNPKTLSALTPLHPCGRTHSELSGVRAEDVVTLVEDVAADGQEQVERQGLQPLTSHRLRVYLFVEDNTDTICPYEHCVSPRCMLFQADI